MLSSNLKPNVLTTTLQARIDDNYLSFWLNKTLEKKGLKVGQPNKYYLEHTLDILRKGFWVFKT